MLDNSSVGQVKLCIYHHRMDLNIPLGETMGALASAVQSGKTLYVGLSNYDGEHLQRAATILNELKISFVINQNRYSIFAARLKTMA